MQKRTRTEREQFSTANVVGFPFLALDMEPHHGLFIKGTMSRRISQLSSAKVLFGWLL